MNQLERIMTDIFHKLFYHLYKPLLKSEKPESAVITASGVFAFLQGINIMVLFAIIAILGFDFLDILFKVQNYKVYVAIFYVILTAINYLYFTSENRYKSIIKEYSKKPLQERKRGARLTLLYGLGSIVLIFILAPLRVM